MVSLTYGSPNGNHGNVASFETSMKLSAFLELGSLNVNSVRWGESPLLGVVIGFLHHLRRIRVPLMKACHSDCEMGSRKCEGQRRRAQIAGPWPCSFIIFFQGADVNSVTRRYSW